MMQNSKTKLKKRKNEFKKRVERKRELKHSRESLLERIETLTAKMKVNDNSLLM
jgi:hypothetical protein